MPALLLALALAAAPFPAPRHAPVTERTRCDTGAVLSSDPARGLLRITTPAGVVTFQVGPDVPVFDRAGSPAGPAVALAHGRRVRIWYVVDAGAQAQEIEVQ